MKRQGLAVLIGRTITAVTVKESEKEPRAQLYLTLDNGTHYEIWTAAANMGFASMARDGGQNAIRSHGREDAETVFEVLTDEDGKPHQTVAKNERDLIANRKSLNYDP